MYYYFSLQVAAKAIPYRDVFISHLAVPGGESTGTIFVQSVMSDVEQYITAMDVVIKILKDFFSSNSLDTNDMV
jgi:hypothetical protein